MPESLDGNQYFQYLLRRWVFLVSVCAIAGALAVGVTVLLPKHYTATASLLIEPPAGNDPRTSTAVSPVYLESLRSYEVLASSDTLLARALEKFHLRNAQSPEALETIKRRILKVSKPRETKILQISVTLEDPKQAQAVAQFLAEETVSLSRSANRDSDQELTAGPKSLAAEAAAEVEQAQAQSAELNVREPIEPLRASLQALTDLQARVRQDLSETRAQAAELAGDPRAAGAKARAEVLDKQDAELTRQISEKATQLARRSSREDETRQRLKSAETNYDAATKRLREVRDTAGTRSERLRVIDPSVIPERPSSPNVLLNLALAIGVGLLGAVVFLTLTLKPNAS